MLVGLGVWYYSYVTPIYLVKILLHKFPMLEADMLELGLVAKSKRSVDIL
jgi:hypothetical protein